MQAMQKMWVRSLRQEDALKKEMATHSSIPAWWGRKESDMTEDRDLDLKICLYREIAIFMETMYKTFVLFFAIWNHTFNLLSWKHHKNMLIKIPHKYNLEGILLTLPLLLDIYEL